MNLTCPTEIVSSSKRRLDRLHLFFSEENQEIDSFQRNGNYLFPFASSQAIRLSKTFRNSYFANSKKQNNKAKIMSFLKIYMLPNFLGSLLFFLISYIDYIAPCDPGNMWVSAYRYTFELLFDLAFYSFFVYHMLFPFIFKKIKNKKWANTFNWLIIGIYGAHHILFQVIVKIGLLDDFLYMQIINLTISHLFIWIICRYGRIKFSEIKHNYIIFAISAIFLIFNHYAMKGKVVLLLKEIFMKENRILFKLFLFVYFNVFRAFLNTILASHIKYCRLTKCENNDYGIIIFSKFVLSDLISSVLIPVLSCNEDSLDFLVNVFLFGYQIAIIYLKSNILIEYGKKKYCCML